MTKNNYVAKIHWKIYYDYRLNIMRDAKIRDLFRKVNGINDEGCSGQPLLIVDDLVGKVEKKL